MNSMMGISTVYSKTTDLSLYLTSRKYTWSFFQSKSKPAKLSQETTRNRKRNNQANDGNSTIC